METTRVIELTNAEKKKLNASLLGYGKLTEASKKTGLHINTLRQISFKGYGTPEAINTIREKLLGSDKVETITETSN